MGRALWAAQVACWIVDLHLLVRPKPFLTLVNDTGAVREPLSRIPLEDALEQLLWLLSKLSELTLELTKGSAVFKLDVCSAWVRPAEATNLTEARQQTQDLT
jgi:hypothetical protein